MTTQDTHRDRSCKGRRDGSSREDTVTWETIQDKLKPQDNTRRNLWDSNKNRGKDSLDSARKVKVPCWCSWRREDENLRGGGGMGHYENLRGGGGMGH